MTVIKSELELLQHDIGKKLSSESYFSDIAVFVVRSRTVEEAVSSAVGGITRKNGKTGMALQVMMPFVSCVAEYEQVAGPFLTVHFVVRVQEIPSINMGPIGTGKTGEEVSLKVLNLLHLFHFGRSLAEFRVSPNALVPTLEYEPRLTYDLEFHSPYQLAAAERVPMPAGQMNEDGKLALSCSNAQAAIYYTLNDEDFPAPGGGGALYNPAAPLTVVAGQTVRAAAYLAGQGSKVLRLEID